MSLWWVAFSAKRCALGVVLTEAPTSNQALANTILYKVNPGGGAATMELTPARLACFSHNSRVWVTDPANHNKLYSPEEILEAVPVCRTSHEIEDHLGVTQYSANENPQKGGSA